MSPAAAAGHLNTTLALSSEPLSSSSFLKRYTTTFLLNPIDSYSIGSDVQFANKLCQPGRQTRYSLAFWRWHFVLPARYCQQI
jgi:hypothetical protein